MTQIYGHKWVSSYGEIDHDDTWSKGLVDISLEELAVGFKACIKGGEEWPPSLSQFRALCKPPKRINEAAYRGSAPMIEYKLSQAQKDNGRNLVAELKKRVMAK